MKRFTKNMSEERKNKLCFKLNAISAILYTLISTTVLKEFMQNKTFDAQKLFFTIGMPVCFISLAVYYFSKLKNCNKVNNAN